MMEPVFVQLRFHYLVEHFAVDQEQVGPPHSLFPGVEEDQVLPELMDLILMPSSQSYLE
tara:strand:- start:35 stop:211 length:177 start_codon:yes stop_codon:yes gene_type:complete